jgi:hypothetical protein
MITPPSEKNIPELLWTLKNMITPPSKKIYQNFSGPLNTTCKNMITPPSKKIYQKFSGP